MNADGLDPSLLDSETAQPTPAAAAQPTPAVEAVTPEALAKYHKMIKMGLPRGAVEQKMNAEGLNPVLLDAPALAPTATSESTHVPPPAPVSCAAKYQRMLKIGLPRGAVEQKVSSDNHSQLTRPNA